MIGQRYTIKDIAHFAQVSRGTVDRVINGRGTISKETYTKVKLILDKLNYRPNLVAQTLRKGELHRLAVLIPDFHFDIYWKRPTDGIDRAATDYSSIGVRVDKFLFNPNRSSSFRQHVNTIIEGKYNGVLIAPVFYRESMDFFRKCEKINLPFITFNTYVEDSGAVCHIGQDLLQSGRTAASLMNKLITAKDELLIIHIEEVLENSRHMQEKEMGFMQFFNENNHFSGAIHVLKISNIKRFEKMLLLTLKANPAIKGIYVTTSKVHHVARVLHRHSLMRHVIGYDLIEENITYMNSGYIDFLIYQNPGSQANQGISSLVDYLVFNKTCQGKKLLPVEIVIKENIENYLH